MSINLPHRRALLGGRKQFDPRGILGSRLLGWWSADRSDLMTLSGAQVSSWRDVVAGYDVSQAISGSKPLLGQESFGGAAGVTFDGLDDELTLAGVPFPIGAEPCEMWAVVQQDILVSDTGARAAVSYGSATNSSRQLRRVVNSGSNRGQTITGEGSSNTSITGTAVNFSSRHVIRGSFGGTATTLFVDGVQTGPSASTPNTATVRTRIGANPIPTAGTFWGGVIRHVIVTGPLSSVQSENLSTWAMAQRMV